MRSADHCGRDHGQAIPAAADALGLQTGVARLDVVIQARACPKHRHENSRPGKTISWHRWASAAPIGSMTSLTQYCRRFSSRQALEAEPRLVDVGVGVEDPPRQPRLQVLLPEGAIHVGVVPDVVQGNRFIRRLPGAMASEQVMLARDRSGDRLLPATGATCVNRLARNCEKLSSTARYAGTSRPSTRRDSAGARPASELRPAAASGSDQRAGEHRRPKALTSDDLDARHRQAGHVGDDLRRDAAGGRAAAHRQAAATAKPAAVSKPQMPRQLAGQALDHRAEQVAGPWAKVMPSSRPPARNGGSASAPASKQRPESQPVAARRHAADQVVDLRSRGVRRGPAGSSPTGSPSRRCPCESIWP